MPAEAPPAQPPTAPPTPGPSDAARAARAEAEGARRGAVASWMSGLGPVEAPPATSVEPPADSPPSPPPTPAPAPAKPSAPPAAAQSTPTPAPAAEPPATKPLGGASDAPPDPDKWPRSAKEWDTFKQIRNENYRKRDERIAALEKELSAREERLKGFANAVDPKEHSAVREERDKLSEALRLAAVEKHPKFQAYYDGKVAQQIETAKRIVGAERAEAVATLLKLPDSDYRNSRIEELLGDLTPVASTRLGSIINAVDELRAEREGEVARAREDYDKALAKQQADQTAAQTTARANAERLFAETLRTAQAGALPMLQPRDATADPSAASWNSAVEQRVAAAKNILFGQEKPEELVRAALAAVSFPALLEAHATLQAENAKLTEQVNALRTATPNVSRGSAPAPADGQPRPSTLKPGSRPMQAAAEWIGLLNQPAENSA